MNDIAIVGSGPTSLYALKHLLATGIVARLTVYESQTQPGMGMPYHPDWNSSAMLSNIASIEIPPVTESLVAWLSRQPDALLHKMDVERSSIHERTFFPRLVLGQYFKAQFLCLLERAQNAGMQVTVKTQHLVTDISADEDGFWLRARGPEGMVSSAHFTHLITATGHNWPKASEVSPGYFLSPWPVACLRSIGQCHVGVLGTSLSAIDAVVALATARGSFRRNADGRMIYLQEPGTEAFRMTLMSRKGLLPEADFYCPIPYAPLTRCTEPAVQALIQVTPAPERLDALFALFKHELAACDPAYAEQLQLDALTLEDWPTAYFRARKTKDAFASAEENLAEAQRNYRECRTVAWRYAILRMHEAIGDAVRHLCSLDMERFNRYFKPVFVDNYATVPHASIERLLALRSAGKLDIFKLGRDYTLTRCPSGGATVHVDDRILYFPAFIEATGQKKQRLSDFPFPTLVRQGIVACEADGDSVALDETYRPLSTLPIASRFYCLSLPFVLGRHPFSQGITSSNEMGKVVARAIAAAYDAPSVRLPNPAAIAPLLQESVL